MPKTVVNHIQMHYEENGQGEPLVFIHGLGSSTRDWELQVGEFSKDYRVITLDLRGHGQSDKPGGRYSMPMFADDVVGLLKALDIEAAHVVGLSLGGMVAFQLALDFPGMVKTLVIVNSFPEVVIRSFKDLLDALQRFAIVRLKGMRKMGEVLASRLFPKEEHAPIRAIFADRWAENDTRAYQNTMKAILGWSVTKRLGTIQCPTLVIAADQDYTPVAHKEAYTKLIPSAQLVVIPDSRHATPVEHPEVFNATLREFLRSRKG